MRDRHALYCHYSTRHPGLAPGSIVLPQEPRINGPRRKAGVTNESEGAGVHQGRTWPVPRTRYL